MTDFAMGVLTHLGAAVAGFMIARNPDTVLGWLAAAWVWIGARIKKPAKPAEPPKAG